MLYPNKGEIKMLDKIMNSLRLSQDEDYDDEYTYEDEQEETTLSYDNRKKAPEIMKAGKNRMDISNPNIIITKPRKLNDAKDIIDKLQEGNTIAVDLEYTPENQKQRIMDMLAGYCYCTQSNIESINSNIYIISHTGIELEEETKQNEFGAQAVVGPMLFLFAQNIGVIFHSQQMCTNDLGKLPQKHVELIWRENKGYV